MENNIQRKVQRLDTGKQIPYYIHNLTFDSMELEKVAMAHYYCNHGPLCCNQ